jgi:hypothetical protein
MLNLVSDPATIQWTVPLGGTLPLSFSIVTTTACNTIRAKQLAGRAIAFVVTDANNAKSPVSVPANGEYVFQAGYAANATAGSITVNDVVDFPEEHEFIFEFTQR